MNDELPSEVGKRFGDLSGLPEELLRQIPSVKMDELERDIVSLVREDFEGVASVDEILVGIYRRSGVVEDRKKLAGKLYRMVQNKPPLLIPVQGKRGVYRLP